jgi:hypothetical protein
MATSNQKTPTDNTAVEPPAVAPNMAQTGHFIRTFESTLNEMKADVVIIKGNHHSDFRLLITYFAGGFLLLAGMLIFGYFRLDDHYTKLDDKINSVVISNTRVDTKLDDLLQRIPPIVVPVPNR